jgi:hypothetical protein
MSIKRPHRGGWCLLAVSALTATPCFCSSVLEDFETLRHLEQQRSSLMVPLNLNANLQAGGLLTQSARMAPDGEISFGGAVTHPFLGAGLSLQLMPRVNLAINYRKEGSPYAWDQLTNGWRECQERKTLLKVQLLSETDFDGWFPSIALGSTDLFGLGISESFYIVGTQTLPSWGVEGSLGWSHGTHGGWFCSAVWSPFRWSKTPLGGLSLLAEWTNPGFSIEKDHHGWLWPSHDVNVGLSYRWRDLLQLSVASLGGQQTYASVSFRADLGPAIRGTPKLMDRPLQCVSCNWQPMGPLRAQQDLAADLSTLLGQHGLILQGAWAQTSENGRPELHLRVVNQTYRWLKDLRETLQQVLGSQVPDSFESVSVTIMAYGAETQRIKWTTQDLHAWKMRVLSLEDISAASPPLPVEKLRNPTVVFKRPLHTWQIDVLPYTESVWLKELGGSQGIYGIAVGPQGYFLDHYFYRAKLNITGWNGLVGYCDEQLLTPSPSIIVRSDMILYNLQGKLRLSEAFVQRTWSSARGFYLRASAGYYDLAFGGAALEALWYPVGSSWAIGVEAAPLLKRRYAGLGFTSTARFGGTPDQPCRQFFPWQLFVDIYSLYKPWSLELKASFGHFLARDVGMRLEATRVWPSGMRLTVWGSWSQLPASAGSQILADRGVGFSIPIDILLPRRSRGRYQYATAAVYPDVGARVTTGIPLYRVIADERLDQPSPMW